MEQRILLSASQTGYDSYAQALRLVGGAPQGGAIFTLADFTFAVASNSSGSYIVSIGCSISFMNAARGKVLYAKAVRRSQSRRISYYDVEVYDELQTPVAKMSVTGYNKNTPLAI